MDKIIEMYNELTPVQKTYLRDFQILHTIYSKKKHFSEEIITDLYNIIDRVSSADNENISVSYIADSIVDAYVDKEISLESLENAEDTQILECIQELDSFESLEDEMEELE